MLKRQLEKFIQDFGDHYLFENSLGRIWQHSKNGFILMSSFRGNDFKKNMSNHKELKSILKSKNLGFFEVNGVYKYDNGDVENELSVFIPYRKDKYTFNEFVEIGKALRKKFNQESILISDNNENIYLQYSNKKETIGKKITVDKVGFAYSQLRTGSHKDRTFIIESVRKPYNHIQAYKFKAENLLF